MVPGQSRCVALLQDNSSLPQSRLAEALKTFPKWKDGNDLAMENPFFDPRAKPENNVPTPATLEAAMRPIFEAAGLDVDRARLFLEEEPNAVNGPDIILTSIVVNVGESEAVAEYLPGADALAARLWPTEKCLGDVHTRLRLLLPLTAYRPLSRTALAALREAEGTGERNPQMPLTLDPPLKVGATLSPSQCAAVARSLQHLFGALGWTEAHVRDYVDSRKVKSKKKDFPYLRIDKLLGRCTSR